MKRTLRDRLRTIDQRANERRRRAGIARAARQAVRALSNPFGCEHHELQYCQRCTQFVLPLKGSS